MSADAKEAAVAAADSLGPQLFKAAAAGDEPLVEQLIEQGADVTWADDEGTTALMTAAENGQLAVVLALLQAGSPWNQQDKAGYCAGEYATASKNQDIVELLMEWGVQAELVLMAAERWGALSCLAFCSSHKQTTTQRSQQILLMVRY
jgi:hypothetical protein